MGVLEIVCMTCGAANQIPPELITKADTIPLRCPHCLSQMEPEAWEKAVDAFWTMEEANKALREAREGGHKDPLFQIQYKQHYVPAELVGNKI